MSNTSIAATPSTLGLRASKEYGLSVAATAILGALVGAAWIAQRRYAARKSRIAMLERERSADRALREERLRRIEAELEAALPSS
jgi:hypothetical protein